MADRINWRVTPILFIERPGCPHCGHERWINGGSSNGGDGSTCQRAICRACSRPFRIVREPSPRWGDSAVRPDMICEEGE
jgi:hypothetical protein